MNLWRAPRRSYRGKARSSTLARLELDHVLIAVTDLAAAAHAFEARHGLASIEGGRHPGYGTANRIVPLGDCYLELVTVAHAAKAADHPFGSWVARSRPGRLLGWAVRTDELDAVARRLDLTTFTGERATPGGEILRWRVAGIEQAAAEPSLPFFIEWADGTPLPGRAPAGHPAGAVRVAELNLEGDADRVADWLGAERLPITVAPGAPALTGIVLAGPAGEIVVDQL
jgi:hypothetical protein